MDYLLKFKHGLLANMKENSPELAPGTVYITRDERAMYVDLPPYMDGDQQVQAGKRIRIGDMRVYTYIEDLKSELANDMSALTLSALYYAEKSKGMVDGTHVPAQDKTINALLKWNGSEFIQLNSISDVTVNLNELTTRVADVESAVETNALAIAGIKATADAAATQAEVDLIKSDVAQNTTDIATERERAEGVEADFEERIAKMETFWDAADDNEIIDKLAEIVNYINADESGALDMAGDIQANTEAIDDIKEDIAELSNNLTAEITARETGDTNTLNSAKEYVDNRLTWEQF